MSIRLRLLLIITFAAALMTGAVFGMMQLLSSRLSVQIEHAESTTSELSEALASAYKSKASELSLSNWSDLNETSLSALRDVTVLTLSSTLRSAGGICTRNGAIVLGSNGGRRGLRTKKLRLAVEHQNRIENFCKQVSTMGTNHQHTQFQDDIFVVSLTGLDEQTFAWSTLALRARSEQANPWRIVLAILVIGTFALVAVTFEAMFTLGKGVEQLRYSLQQLRNDLSTNVPSPRARELADIAYGLKEMAEHLRQAQDREKQALTKLSHEQRLSALGRVVAGTAHEIRNPLAGIKLRLDLLAQTASLRTSEQEDIQVCLNEVARLDRLVRTLLEVSRKKENIKQELQLGSFLDQRIALLSELAMQHHATCIRKGDAVVSIETDGLSRVVDNLLRNAIEANRERKEIWIVVESHVSTEEGVESIEIAIIDHGPGVEPERIQELFEPFFTTKPEGTGLGLWLSRVWLQALGGDLRYERDLSIGQTKFIVSLPQTKRESIQT